LENSIQNDWRTLEGTNPLNHSFQYVRGVSIQRKQKDFLGLLFSVTYSRTYNHTFGDRKSIDFDRANAAQAPVLKSDYVDNNFSSQTLAGIMGNISYKIDNNNKISLKNIISN